MRGKGINYDTGFYLDPQGSRPEFSPGIVAREMRVIASELGCTAVRVSGGKPERLSVAAEAAAAEGLEVWFAPFPVDLPAGQAASLLADCAGRAEHLRRTGASVVLVAGCELTLFGAGFLPGATFPDRLTGLQAPGPELYAAFGALPGKLNGFLGETAEAARAIAGTFSGRAYSRSSKSRARRRCASSVTSIRGPYTVSACTGQPWAPLRPGSNGR